MPQNKVYAVKQGRETGIFNSWSECQQAVKGYSGAEYKSFNDIEKAKKYLNNGYFENKVKEINQLKADEMIAYVDGSYDSQVNYYSYGAICFYGDEKRLFSDRGRKEELLKMRNVGGEIKAAQVAMNAAIKNKLTKLYLHYDYEGIEKWCTGDWKANKTATRKYKEYFNSIKDKLEVEFIKVKAHSGEKYNEEVDVLAKEALYNESSFNFEEV
jgi:ribonuclease HI